LSVLQLLVTPLGYSDCIVCPSIYNFWLALLCIQTIVCPKIYNFSLILWCIQNALSVLRFTTSGYSFGVFRLHCLSFDLELLVTPLVYSDCIVCPSIYNFWLALLCIQNIVCPKIYNFWLILWCIQTALCVLRFTTSGYPFGVFRLHWLSFDLQLLVTPLMYSDCIVCPLIYNFWYTPLVYSDCIVCPLIYNFWLPLWCIQTLLSVLRFTTSGYPFCVFRLLSVLQFTTSDYPFGVFRLHCLSFDLQLLVTPLVYSDCIVCPLIYNFWLPLWCIQTVLSVLLFTTSGYPFGVFRLYCLSLDLQLLVTPLLYSDYCLSFDLQLLVTPLVYSDCIVCPLFTTSGYPFGVFRLYCLSFYLQLLIYSFGVFRLYCLSFNLQLLITPLVYSDCIVCPSIYNYWLPLWCIQTVLFVLWFTTSGYPFGVFRLYCLSLDLQLLVTLLLYSDCIVCPSIYNFWLPLLCIQTIVCPKIYNFWLLLWCIQTVLFVLRFTTSGYSFCVFRL
jgi:hypothetical protein